MEFMQYMGEVLTFTNLAVLIAGSMAGLLLGAMPGLSPTMAVALLIPFTFHMPATVGLILLGAVYTSTVAGGAISAILVNIPGAPANIATTLDGHALASRGRAAEALHYCFISSLIGGLLGVFVLIFFTPVLAEVALQFGPSELFWIAILGITIIATIGGGSALKGLISGAVGLWLSTVGYSPVLGVERFAYSEHLSGGINIVAALIGLFAIPQVLRMMQNAATQSEAKIFDLGSSPLWQSIRYNLSRIKALFIGSVAGIVVGIIPGAGGQIAGLVAYDQTRKLSKNPERFGRGEPDGIICAESANNGMVGPSLVPLLTLGIPGSPTAAVLLGGLLIHGLFPGPDLFTTHASVTWTFINSLILAQIVMAIFGLAISRYSRWVMSIPLHYMAAAVLILAVYGTYSVQNNFSDVLVMAVLGTGMYFAASHGYSPAPVVLGIILGPIAEDNFLQGQMIAEATDGLWTYFFTGTTNLLLIALCLFSAGYSFFAEYRRQKRTANQSSGEMAEGRS